MRCKSDANSLEALTEDAIQAVHRLARDPNVGERIIDSIAPSIYGHRDIKACIALALFGGQEKHVGSHRLRYAHCYSVPPPPPFLLSTTQQTFMSFRADYNMLFLYNHQCCKGYELYVHR